MRDIVFTMLFTVMCGFAFQAPIAGILLWGWLTMMNPHQLTWGFATSIPVNMIVALITFIVLFSQKGRKLPPKNALVVVFFIFFVWCNFTTIFALNYDIAMYRWDLSIKSMIFGWVVATLLTTRMRVRAMVWVFAISYAYFGVKGGGFTIVTGGGGDVNGPPASTISDRNHLALVMLMALPMLGFLRQTSTYPLTRWGLAAAMVLTAVAVIGTFSRGGLIGLVAMGGFLWWKSKSKIPVMLAAVIVAVTAYNVMPDHWFQRMDTIQTAESDGSFKGRLQAWQFAFNAANSRLTGVGFSVTQDAQVYNRYSPDPTIVFLSGRAAHSIYFQVLGDHGYPGLILFLTLLALLWFKASHMSSAAVRATPGLEWASDLGAMIKVSLVGYVVGGAALSMAYDSSIMALLGITVGAGYVVDRQLQESRQPARAMPQHGRPVRVAAK